MKEIGYALLAVLLMAGCGLDSGEKKTPAAEDIPAAQEIKVHEIPEASEALYHKAAQAYGKGHRTEALRLANQAINEDGENYKALSLKGIILASIFLLMKGFLLLKRRFPFHLPMYRLIMTWPLLKN